MFLEISQNSQEKSRARVAFFHQLYTTLLKKSPWYMCFPVNFAKNSFLQNTSGQLILKEKVSIVKKTPLRLVLPYLGLKTRTKLQKSIKEVLGYLTAVNYKLFLKVKINTINGSERTFSSSLSVCISSCHIVCWTLWSVLYLFLWKLLNLKKNGKF